MNSIINFDEISITKDYILNKITEEEIFCYYLGYNFEYKKLYKSPLRNKDKNPSFNIMQDNIGINYKDWGYTHGNCFEFIKNLFGCDYQTALKKIAFDFKLSNKEINLNKIKQNNKEIIKFDKKIIPVKKAFTLIDYNYWIQYYIELDLLIKENIISCKYAYLKKDYDNLKIWANYEDNNPLYCFHIDNKHKLYRPLSLDKRAKWLSTAGINNIQGLSSLPKNGGDLLVITSSMKDKLVMNVLGYDSIAPGGEDTPIPKEIMDYLWSIYSTIVCFYDNDSVGIKCTLKFVEQNPGVIPIFYPNYIEQKDISDFIQINKLIETKKLVKTIL